MKTVESNKYFNHRFLFKFLCFSTIFIVFTVCNLLQPNMYIYVHVHIWTSITASSFMRKLQPLHIFAVGLHFHLHRRSRSASRSAHLWADCSCNMKLWSLWYRITKR